MMRIDAVLNENFSESLSLMKETGGFAVAIVQCTSVVGDVRGNLEVVEKHCAEACLRHVDLVLFPECNITGYSYLDLATLIGKTAQPLEGSIGKRLRILARRFGLVICCGMLERDGGRVFNSHVVAFPDGRLEAQRKGELTLREAALLASEPVRRVFEWKGHRFGILVCADSGLPDFREQFDRLGISLLLHPSAGRIEQTGCRENDLLKAHIEPTLRNAALLAREMNVVYAVANPIGFSGEDYYPGNSWVIHPRKGLLVGLLPTGLEEKMRGEMGIAAYGMAW